MITKLSITEVLKGVNGNEVVAPKHEWKIVWDRCLYIMPDTPICSDEFIDKTIMQWFVDNQPAISQDAINELSWMRGTKCGIYLKYYYNQNAGK